MTRAEYIEGAIWLCSLSPLHHSWTIDGFIRNFMPPIHRGQFKVYKNSEGRLTGIVTWAYVSNENDRRLREIGATPPMDAWSDGPNLWIIDLIAPFGDAMSISRDLQCSVFADWREPVWALRRKPDGTVRKVNRWPTLAVLDRALPQK